MRDLIEKVDRGILHDLLMERAVLRSALEQCVLPAARILAGLTLTVADVLAEINTFLR